MYMSHRFPFKNESPAHRSQHTKEWRLMTFMELYPNMKSKKKSSQNWGILHWRSTIIHKTSLIPFASASVSSVSTETVLPNYQIQLASILYGWDAAQELHQKEEMSLVQVYHTSFPTTMNDGM